MDPRRGLQINVEMSNELDYSHYDSLDSSVSSSFSSNNPMTPFTPDSSRRPSIASMSWGFQTSYSSLSPSMMKPGPTNSPVEQTMLYLSIDNPSTEVLGSTPEEGTFYLDDFSAAAATLGNDFLLTMPDRNMQFQPTSMYWDQMELDGDLTASPEFHTGLFTSPETRVAHGLGMDQCFSRPMFGSSPSDHQLQYDTYLSMPQCATPPRTIVPSQHAILDTTPQLRLAEPFETPIKVEPFGTPRSLVTPGSSPLQDGRTSLPQSPLLDFSPFASNGQMADGWSIAAAAASSPSTNSLSRPKTCASRRLTGKPPSGSKPPSNGNGNGKRIPIRSVTRVSKGDKDKVCKMQVRDEQQPGQWRECGQAFKRPEHLKRHERSALHVPDVKPYKCPLCNRGFNRTDNVRPHVKNTHLTKSKTTERNSRYKLAEAMAAGYVPDEGRRRKGGKVAKPARSVGGRRGKH